MEKQALLSMAVSIGANTALKNAGLTKVAFMPELIHLLARGAKSVGKELGHPIEKFNEGTRLLGVSKAMGGSASSREAAKNFWEGLLKILPLTTMVAAPVGGAVALSKYYPKLEEKYNNL